MGGSIRLIDLEANLVIRLDRGNRALEGSSTMNTSLAMALFWVCLCPPVLFAQGAPEGIWQGYDGEWKHVSQQLVA